MDSSWYEFEPGDQPEHVTYSLTSVEGLTCSDTFIFKSYQISVVKIHLSKKKFCWGHPVDIAKITRSWNSYIRQSTSWLLFKSEIISNQKVICAQSSALHCQGDDQLSAAVPVDVANPSI